MNAQREECSSERQQDTACPWNICGPVPRLTRWGRDLFVLRSLSQLAHHRETNPGSYRGKKKSGGEIFEKGRVEKVFMIWPLGLHRDRCAKARSHPDSCTGLVLAETNKRVSNNGAEQETGSGCSVYLHTDG